jgi:hypothetical protein
MAVDQRLLSAFYFVVSHGFAFLSALNSLRTIESFLLFGKNQYCGDQYEK